MSPMLRSSHPFGDPPTYPMGVRKTRNLELAQARGEPLEDTCPVRAYPVPDAASWELDEVRNAWIVTFYPCEHRGYPQWPTTSRFLHEDIAQPSRPSWRQRRVGRGAKGAAV